LWLSFIRWLSHTGTGWGKVFQKACSSTDLGPLEWRTHFHVPVFLDDSGGQFGTTRFALEDALKMHKEKPLSAQLEIETDTRDVLPEHLKTAISSTMFAARSNGFAGNCFVALRPGGICDSLSFCGIHLAMGTYSVAVIRTLEAAHRDSGQFLVAAPVLGRPDLAAAEGLKFFV
jgi:hypothetical protein